MWMSVCGKLILFLVTPLKKKLIFCKSERGGSKDVLSKAPQDKALAYSELWASEKQGGVCSEESYYATDIILSTLLWGRYCHVHCSDEVIKA